MIRFIDTQKPGEWAPDIKHPVKAFKTVSSAQAWLDANGMPHIKADDGSHPFLNPLPAGKRGKWIGGEFVVENVPDPTKQELKQQAYDDQRIMSAKQFIERFTINELKAIYHHNAGVVDAQIWMDRLTGAEFVDADDPALRNGMAYYVMQGLITQERHDHILGDDLL